MTVCTIAGIPIKIHPTFLLLSFFIVTSAAKTDVLIPYEAFVRYTYGVYVVIMLATSVVLHELGHAFAAKMYGIKTTKISLNMLGGVAVPERNLKTADEEIWIGIAGPAMSLIIAFVGFALLLMPSDIVLIRLFIVFSVVANTTLFVFNMIPMYPMDGGRVFHGLYWKICGCQYRAMLVGSVLGGFLSICMFLFAVHIGAISAAIISILIMFTAITRYALAKKTLKEAFSKVDADSIIQRYDL